MMFFVRFEVFTEERMMVMMMMMIWVLAPTPRTSLSSSSPP
jgi:hypothetical protein